MIALTHVPSPNMQACEKTFVPPAAIDSQQVAGQHAAYCQLLASCGLEVRTLAMNCDMPDCVFLEDIAVVLDEVAILASMGAASRRAEPAGMAPVLCEYRRVETVELPATLEGGDVLRVDKKLLVGLSRRTNAAGVAALAAIVQRFGYDVQAVPVGQALHLKTASCALPDGRLLVNRAWLDADALHGHELVDVPTHEPWGANIALVGNTVLMNAAHVHTAELVRSLGFAVRTIDLSELAKAEGGVTCLSLVIG